MTRVHVRLVEVTKMLNVDQCNPVLVSLPSSSVTYHKRASSVPLIELKHSEDENSSCGSEDTSFCGSSSALNNETDPYCSKGGICSVTDTMDNPREGRGASPITPPTVKIKHITRNVGGSTRFPKLDECAHFHYENVELGPVKMELFDEKQDVGKSMTNYSDKENEQCCRWYWIRVISNGRMWTVRRSYDNFRMLDRQLHRCIYDRKYSLLPELALIDQLYQDTEEDLRHLLTSYLDRFSDLAGSLINCGPVLNWLELDNRGNRLIVPDESAINTPAVAAAYVIRRYTAQATDEISFEVGDMISVIDMPPPEESIWWRGKKGFEVGFFPCECIEVIGDKIPHTLKVPKAPTKPVLRKHGKLIAFFRSFLLSRPSRRKLKQSGILKERVFGCDLGEHLLNSGREIPLVLKCCTEFIEEHGIVDGIYRLSGVNSNIQKLRLAFDEDRIPDLTDEAILQDIHCVASLLKMYFRELPNPLLTYQLYDKFVNAVQSEEEMRLLRLRDIVQQLPPPHYRTLEYLMQHLAKVAGHGGRTGMTPKNVAIVWAPNLLRSKDVEGGGVGALHVVGVQAVLTEYLIRYADIIFNEKLPAFHSSGSNESSPRRARPKSLAISTPTKLLSLEEARTRALCANLPPTQQKYIDVGGGPDKLPPKYHTVIDFPGGKRGSGKIKKSPSGWKSFFSRGWHSGSTREKDRVRTQRKVSSGSLQHTSLPIQDVAVTETDISHIKKLRTVKSAESLVLLGGGSSCRSSGASETFSISVLMKGREIPDATSYSADKRSVLMDYADSEDDSQESPCLSLKSPHLKHNRSSSHESYFEQDMDIPQEEHEMEEDNSIYDLVNKTIIKMKGKESDGLFDCKENENNTNQFEYQTQNASESDTLPLSDLSDNGQEDFVKTLLDNDNETHKAVRKQKFDDVDSEIANAKVQKLSMIRFQQSINSSVERQIDEFSDNENTSEKFESLKNSEFVIDKLNSDMLQNSFSQNESDCLLDTLKNDNSLLHNTNDNDVINENIVNQPTVQDDTSKIVVERYGNEETVIVEVHATQESSDEEQERSQTFIENEDNDVKYKGNKNDLILYESVYYKKSDEYVDEESQLSTGSVDILDKSTDNFELETDSRTLFETSNTSFVNNNTKYPTLPKESIIQKTEDNEDTLLHLKPGSFTSEMMEKYLLIKESLDKRHFEVQNEQNYISGEISDTKNVSYADSEHKSKDEIKPDLLISCEINKTSETSEAKIDVIKNVQNNSNKEQINSSVSSENPKSEDQLRTFLLQDNIFTKENMSSPNLFETLSEDSSQNNKFLDGVQLRCSSDKSLASYLNEKKRNSEPEKNLIETKHIYSNVLDRKRMSEPSSQFPSQHGEKSTVKGLMLKFESPVEKDDTISDRHSNTTKENISKPKTTHPSLFTQLKVLKLQSLQSGSSITSPVDSVDPWSDPILDIEEEKESHLLPSNNRPSLIVQDVNIEVIDKYESNSLIPKVDSVKNEIIQVQLKEEIDAVDTKQTKCNQGLSVSTPDLIHSNNTKPVEVICAISSLIHSSDTAVPNAFSSKVEDESIRRERINRIKEERRAQLREKLKSESFRLEAEEKEKVLNEFRLRKHSSGTKPLDTPGEQIKHNLSKTGKDKSKNNDTIKAKWVASTNINVHTSEIPKQRINSSVYRMSPQKGNIEKQEKNKRPLHGNTSGNVPFNQEKNNSKTTSPVKQTEKVSCKSPTKERLRKSVSVDNSKLSSCSDIRSVSQSSKLGKKIGDQVEKISLPDKLLPQNSQSQDSKHIHPTNQRISAVSQKRIRERAAMFEHPKDSQEPCRTVTPSNRFARQRSSPSLTPSYVR